MLTQEITPAKPTPLARPWRQKFARWVFVGTCLWLFLAVLLMTCLVLWDRLNCPWPVALYLLATVFGSAACFLAYWIDKRRAERDRFRVSEKTLQWLAFLGGWPGGLLGQKTFRHKTQKWNFQVLFWLIVMLHVPLVLWSLWSIRLGG